MKTVLVIGANGQLGQCLQEATAGDSAIDWLFTSSTEVDISSTRDLQQCFSNKRIDFCINCAAYTNVEKAESQQEAAYLINAEAVKNLAEICNKYQTVLFHISTDYVFDGMANRPYQESDAPNPINVYGASKLKGEEYIQKITNYYFIFRTSWLYSEYGHNFYKTILQKASEGATLNITTAQKGTPTNAHHLAALIVELIQENNAEYGLYHFSNSGETTWYGFAREILRVAGKLDDVILNEDNTYKTIAARPAYSVLDKTQIAETLKISPAPWETALKQLYQKNVKIN